MSLYFFLYVVRNYKSTFVPEIFQNCKGNHVISCYHVIGAYRGACVWEKAIRQGQEHMRRGGDFKTAVIWIFSLYRANN